MRLYVEPPLTEGLLPSRKGYSRKMNRAWDSAGGTSDRGGTSPDAQGGCIAVAGTLRYAAYGLVRSGDGISRVGTLLLAATLTAARSG